MSKIVNNNIFGGGTSITGTGVATTGGYQELESGVIDSRNQKVSYGMSIGAYVWGYSNASAWIYGSNDLSSWTQVDSASGGANSAFCKTGTSTRFRYYKCKVKCGEKQNASSAYVFVSE